MCSKRKFGTRVEASDSELFDLFLWPPEQGHNEADIPVDVDLMFDVETLDVSGTQCTVFLTKAEVKLSLTDFVLVRGSRLGEEIKPILESQEITERITEKILGSGKLDLGGDVSTSGKLEGAIGAALSASRERQSESESVIQRKNVFRRVRPTTKGRWVIAEPTAGEGGRLLGKYISAPTEENSDGFSLCDIQEDGDDPQLTISLYCRPMDVGFEISRDATVIEKIKGNLTNKERVAAAVKAKSLKAEGSDGLILLATAILTRDDEERD